MFLLLLSANVFGQDTARVKYKYAYDGDTLTVTKLSANFNNHKILCFEYGAEAIIYVDENNIRLQAVKDTLNDWTPVKQEGKEVLGLLDSLGKNRDTVFIKTFRPQFRYLISQQLITGNAKVYDRKTKIFVPVILHRLERIIDMADRHFYFADKRQFFRSPEWSGLLPNEFMELE